MCVCVCVCVRARHELLSTTHERARAHPLFFSPQISPYLQEIYVIRLIIQKITDYCAPAAGPGGL